MFIFWRIQNDRLSHLIQPGWFISDDPEPPDVLHMAVLSSLLRMALVMKVINKCIPFFLYLPIKTQFLSPLRKHRMRQRIFFDGQGRWVAARWPTYSRFRIETDSPVGLSPLRNLFIISDFDLSFPLSFLLFASSLLEQHVRLVIFIDDYLHMKLYFYIVESHRLALDLSKDWELYLFYNLMLNIVLA